MKKKEHKLLDCCGVNMDGEDAETKCITFEWSFPGPFLVARKERIEPLFSPNDFFWPKKTPIYHLNWHFGIAYGLKRTRFCAHKFHAHAFRTAKEGNNFE